MDPIIISMLILFGADTVAFIASLIITRVVMGMPSNKALIFSSLIGLAVGLLAFLPYLFTHVLNAPK